MVASKFDVDEHLRKIMVKNDLQLLFEKVEGTIERNQWSN
jgi:hypothetical protein